MIERLQCQRSMGSTSNDLSAAIQQMLEALAQNDELKRGLRIATKQHQRGRSHTTGIDQN